MEHTQQEEFTSRYCDHVSNLILEHSRFRDYRGILTDSFEVIEIIKDSECRYPVVAPIKTKDYGGDTDLMDDTNEYTIDDYNKILNRFKVEKEIAKLKSQGRRKEALIKSL